jgi:hypothetical protein
MGIAKRHGLIKDKKEHEFPGADGKPVAPIINVTLSRE